MKLGEFELTKPVFMAPMAGITDKAFREIIRLVGGKYTFTEMISDKALIYNNSKTIKMLDLSGEDRPRIVQLFGSEPEVMAEAARIAVTYGADVIDINMGCPTPKIVKNKEGAALLKNIPLAVEIAAKVVKAVDVPVTAKLRLGWDSDSIVAPDLAARLEAVGISMLTLHARTREQYYSGQADWSWIRRIKEQIKIPVIGNGDIQTPFDALKMLQETGCDGVMIARGALGNPWLIGKTQHFLETGEIWPEPDAIEKLAIVLKHLEKVITYKGEKIGINEMRKHAAWYLKGTRNAAQFRQQLMVTSDAAQMKELLQKAFLQEN
ncbi:MAG TPA: tRNA dihydrouridine synthase DusB [Peptococcaceae bacterium]|nr:tRNA dihydrouridine synthase DusB [Peptococcaceae bacterium]